MFNKLRTATTFPATLFHRLLNRRYSVREIAFIAAIVICAMPFVSAAIALFAGMAMARLAGNPYAHKQHKITQWLLQSSVVGLAFGMNAHTAVQAGKSAFAFTLTTISATLLAGFLISRLLAIDRRTSWLIAAGTAICGGSAIAAVAPAIKANEKQISVALGTVFILNALALFVFPVIGNVFHLTQEQFGWWCAIAIHDTSSVTGAAARYGKQSLDIATTIKLGRALWIIPVTLLSCRLFKTTGGHIKIPWFILFFILAMMANTYIPVVHEYGNLCVAPAKAGLHVTLFLIGTGMSKNMFQQVGVKPFVLGILLWVAVSVITLWVLLQR